MNGKYSIGIDISKEDFKACFVVIKSDQTIKVKASRTFSNTLSGFKDFNKWYLKHQKEDFPLVFVLEATGSYHEQLSWFLYKEGQKLSVVLPNRAKAYMSSLGLKSKNDKVDAKGLATMGAVQKLRIWEPVSKHLYTLRQLTRHLEDLQIIRTSLMNQREQSRHAMYELNVVDRSIQNTLKTIDKQISNCKEQIKKTIGRDKKLSEKVSYMTSIKGVSTITAAVIIGETNGFALINNVKQLVSYAGYDVRENQSGKRVGKSRITKKGNAHIRRAMHLPAFNTVKYKVRTFENLYNRVYERSEIKMKGYVAVQSKLLRMLYTLWKNETYFDQNYQNPTFHELNFIQKTAEPLSPAARDGLPDVKSPEALFLIV